MFSWPVRIYYEDTDALGIVYYANYFKYFERARTEWLRELGFEQDGLLAEDIGFAVVSLETEFKKPARFNDQLRVNTSLEACKKAAFEFKQEVRKEKNEELLVAARVKVCCVAVSTLAPRAIPKALREEMLRAS